MKYIVQMMLAALASIAIAVPAYAWDFGVSGSASADFYMKSSTAAKDNSSSDSADSISVTTMGDSSGGVTISSSNTDGDTSVDFSLALGEYYDSFTETYSMSGSTKVGDWTGSASGSITNTQAWAEDTDDGDDVDAPGGSAGSAQVSLTDGTITYKLGAASHLSGATKGWTNINNVVSTARAGAAVGSFEGFSVGYAVDDATSLTFAYQNDSAVTILGNQGTTTSASTYFACSGSNAGGTSCEAITDSDASSSNSKYDTTAYGINVATTAGGADVTFTYGTGSMAVKKANDISTDEPGGAVTMSTYGLGVSFAAGDVTPWLNYSNEDNNYNDNSSASDNDIKFSITEMEFGVDLGMVEDWSISVGYGSYKTDKTSGASSKSGSSEDTKFEIGALTSVGGVSIDLSFGTLLSSKSSDESLSDSGTFDDGEKLTKYGVKLSYTF